MTTALQERRTAAAASHGGAPARQAVIRWTWRLFRREWRQQALVLALLIVAIAATTIGLGVVSNASLLKDDPSFGTANTILTLPGSDTDLSGDLAALRTRFGTVEAIAHQSVPIPGSVASLDVREQAPDGPYGHVMLRLDSGRYPTGPTEVAMTAGAAKTFGVHVGVRWAAGGTDRTVVGIVENPLNLLDQFAVVPPGQANRASSVSVLLNANQRALDTFRLPSRTGLNIDRRGTASQAAAAAIVLLLGTLGLLFVGLMSVAGFTVLAHRRQRALGMLASLGATDRHLRLVMLANGAAVGGTAAILGAASGLIGWFAFAPAVQAITNHRVDRLALPWWAIATAALLTVVTAVAAAWWPARAVARLSPVAALSGRPPLPKPAHRFTITGGVLLGSGIALLYFADTRRAGFIISGAVTTVLGLLLLAPLALRLLATAGRRSPIAVTLALRDLVRYQARSGAALGAITMAVGLAATIAISASAADKPTGPGNLATNQLVMAVSRGGPGDPVPRLSAAQLRTAQTNIQQVANDLHASALLLDQAYVPGSQAMPLNPTAGSGGAIASPGQSGPLGGQPSGYLTPVLATVTDHQDVFGMQTLYVATAAVLARYHESASQIEPGADLISARTDLRGLDIFNPSPGPQRKPAPTDIARPTIQAVHQLPLYTSAPSALLTPHAMQILGLVPLPAGWLLQTNSPLTAAQIGLARHAAATAGLYVEVREPKKSSAALRNWSTLVGMLLALGVLAMTVGLIRSESANELRTLAATGAASNTRRTITAATAGALALLGALIGTAGAYLALIAWHHSNLTPLDRVPVVNLVLIVAGLPVVATAASWVLAGREPPAIARQPLE